MEKPPITQPRETKRFAINSPGTCTTPESVFQIQMIDISATGVQFSADKMIPHEKPVTLNWTDSEVGSIQISVAIVRRKQAIDTNTIYFGSQYWSLSENTKTLLIRYLKKIKERQKQKVTRDIETITPQYLFEVISRKKDFVKESLQSQTSQLKSVLADIKDYERDFFNGSDAAAEYMQEVVTHSFHLKLLGLMIPLVVENPQHRSNLFNQVIEIMDNITATETKQDAALALSTPETPNLRPQIIESSNRLFYEKHKLLQAAVDTFVMFEDPENTELLAQIKNEYDRVIEITNQHADPDQQVYARKTKIVEKTREELIQQIQINTEKKPNTLIWVNSILLILFAIGYVINLFLNSSDLSGINEKLQLPIDVESFQRTGSQIDLYLDKKTWERYSNEQKLIVYEKIINYLQDDKKLEFALIFIDGKGMVKMLNEKTQLYNTHIPETAPQTSEPDPETLAPTGTEAPAAATPPTN
jgi:hypothetical protein